MTKEEFCKELYDTNGDEWKNSIIPPPLDAQRAVDILSDHFLGDFYVNYSAGDKQINSEVVACILERYPNPKNKFRSNCDYRNRFFARIKIKIGRFLKKWKNT